MDSPTSKRRILESMFEGGTFKTPEFEYELRSADFVAEIPQTGERFESRDALKAMQEQLGQPPRVELKEIRGEGDIWIVEAIHTYQQGDDFHVCAIVEFNEGKISRETRYYCPPLTATRA